MGGRVRLLSKQWLPWYYVYKLSFLTSWNEVAVHATNTFFYGYQQNAATAIQKLFHGLKNRRDRKGTVNGLVATQTLESFAFEYAKTHLKKNESIILIEENYGMSICSMAISRWGYNPRQNCWDNYYKWNSQSLALLPKPWYPSAPSPPHPSRNVDFNRSFLANHASPSQRH